jgi:hypothetical protein
MIGGNLRRPQQLRMKVTFAHRSVVLTSVHQIVPITVDLAYSRITPRITAVIVDGLRGARGAASHRPQKRSLWRIRRGSLTVL